MVIGRIMRLLLWRLEAIDPVWWLALAGLASIESILLWRIRGTDRFFKTLLWCVLMEHLFLILIATVLTRTEVSEEYELISFDVTTAWAVGPGRYGPIDTAVELLLNVFAFVPLGYLLMRLTNRTCISLGVSVLIILSIETLQLVTGRGFFELADILLNLSGTVIGWIGYFICQRERGRMWET